VQIRVRLETWACTRDQSKEKSPNPFSTTPVGLPFPSAVDVKFVATEIHKLPRRRRF